MLGWVLVTGCLGALWTAIVVTFATVSGAYLAGGFAREAADCVLQVVRTRVNTQDEYAAWPEWKRRRLDRNLGTLEQMSEPARGPDPQIVAILIGGRAEVAERTRLVHERTSRETGLRLEAFDRILADVDTIPLPDLCWRSIWTIRQGKARLRWYAFRDFGWTTYLRIQEESDRLRNRLALLLSFLTLNVGCLLLMVGVDWEWTSIAAAPLVAGSSVGYVLLAYIWWQALATPPEPSVDALSNPGRWLVVAGAGKESQTRRLATQFVLRLGTLVVFGWVSMALCVSLFLRDLDTSQANGEPNSGLVTRNQGGGAPVWTAYAVLVAVMLGGLWVIVRSVRRVLWRSGDPATLARRIRILALNCLLGAYLLGGGGLLLTDRLGLPTPLSTALLFGMLLGVFVIPVILLACSAIVSELQRRERLGRAREAGLEVDALLSPWWIGGGYLLLVTPTFLIPIEPKPADNLWVMGLQVIEFVYSVVVLLLMPVAIISCFVLARRRSRQDALMARLTANRRGC